MVDSTRRYTGPVGEMSTVASCDIYEFRDGLITQITSYTVQIDTSTNATGPA